MSRILLLILFLLWLSAGEPVRPLAGQTTELLLFLGVFALLVLGMGLWSRLLARRLSAHNFRHSLHRFTRFMGMARMVIPAWFAFGLFGLQWHQIVESHLPFLRDWESALLLVGISPALLAWMGLWWSQYPADRALREQNLLIQLNEDLPVQGPPGFWSYFSANLRLQLLFTIIPILLIILLSDVVSLGLRLALHHPPGETVQAIVNIASAAAVFIFAPQILRYVLETETLPDSPLRRRLEGMCQRIGLRYRDILLWRTQNNMGNAAVVGIIPGLRYVLLSDLLLETMPDEQIEAVFAHEMGHIVHRHMIWYVVFFIAMILALAGPGDAISTRILHVINTWFPSPDGNLTPSTMMQLTPLLLLSLGIAAFLIVFGFLSRRFERQADVFAARTMEAGSGISVPASGNSSNRQPATGNRSSCVGPRGAAVFTSALERVAVINNIPIATRSWCHGSIAKRMDYLLHLASDPQRTGQFDRTMARIYTALLAAFAASAAYLFLWHS